LGEGKDVVYLNRLFRYWSEGGGKPCKTCDDNT